MDGSALINAKEKDQEVIGTFDKTRVKKIFEENTNLLRQFINEQGWPTKEEHGLEVSSAAWLIAQHSDHDPMFQLQCLALIISNLNHDDKELMQDIAFLLDRILVNMNQKQIFGTQLNGNFAVPDTITPKNLDSLRKKFGLQQIKEYIERVSKFSEN